MVGECILPDHRNKMDGLEFMSHFGDSTVKVAFFDPQYRGLLEKMSYGNEGQNRFKRRYQLKQMPEEIISAFISQIDRVLVPSGHLFLWMDKFRLCEGFLHWLAGSKLQVVDMIMWYKGRIGMGYRTRRTCEPVVVLQKSPKRAKGVWKDHRIPDVWEEEPTRNQTHPHIKPVRLQRRLIEAVSMEGDWVLDPAAGSFSVMRATKLAGRRFWGCDVVIDPDLFSFVRQRCAYVLC